MATEVFTEGTREAKRAAKQEKDRKSNATRPRHSESGTGKAESGGDHAD